MIAARLVAAVLALVTLAAHHAAVMPAIAGVAVAAVLAVCFVVREVRAQPSWLCPAAVWPAALAARRHVLGVAR